MVATTYLENFAEFLGASGPFLKQYAQEVDQSVLAAISNDAESHLVTWVLRTEDINSVAAAGELLDLTIEHPDANRVRESISILGIDIEVAQAEAFRLVARIQTKHEIKILS